MFTEVNIVMLICVCSMLVGLCSSDSPFGYFFFCRLRQLVDKLLLLEETFQKKQMLKQCSKL